jgi:hypothetical protein
MLSKIWVWDPRSGIREIPILDPGVKKAPATGSANLTLGLVDVYAFSPPYSILKPNCTASVLYGTRVLMLAFVPMSLSANSHSLIMLPKLKYFKYFLLSQIVSRILYDHSF